jgi:hypothetical protein
MEAPIRHGDTLRPVLIEAAQWRALANTTAALDTAPAGGGGPVRNSRFMTQKQRAEIERHFWYINLGAEECQVGAPS